MSDKSPTKRVIDELPSGVKENLSSGEEVIRYLKTFEVVDKPDYIILTNLRLIYFNEKHLGRYAFKSIPFQKLLQIRAHRGVLLWGDISFKGEDNTVILLERVDRNDLEGFLDAVEIAYNSIAVEPISMRHERDLVGKATWEFDKPKEMIVRQQSSDQPKLSEDPLNQLKMKFIKGEISEEEYKAKLRVLQEK
jgi:Bacterial PH domain